MTLSRQNFNWNLLTFSIGTITWNKSRLGLIFKILSKRVRATGRDEKIEKFLFDNQLNSGLSESGQNTTVEENSRNATLGMLPTEINQTGQV